MPARESKEPIPNLCPTETNTLKLVWFLAPTVTLCEQQYEVFKSNLPGYSIQLFSGKDNIDHWTEQAVWDAVLLNVRVVLSTHQVLLDALTHAFVKMRRLALLIFDEGSRPEPDAVAHVSLMTPSSPLHPESSGSQDYVRFLHAASGKGT